MPSACGPLGARRLAGRLCVGPFAPYWPLLAPTGPYWPPLARAQRDGTDGPGADGLASYLRERELLIAVDNFEHLLAAAVLVAELLALAPGIRVLVSSRMKLRIRGEQVFELEPLALPAGESELAVSQSPAVQLFLQRALAFNRKLEDDMSMLRTVAGICRALDGLPLAIELAASRSQSLTLGQIADQLTQPLSIGEHSLRDLPDRQQTLQATNRWSDDLLAPGARVLLRTAAVFLGGFTLPALEAVVAPGELAAPLLADHANLRAALEDAVEAGDQHASLGLALGLRPLWRAGMLRQESEELVDRLLERFSIPADKEVPLLQAVAFLNYRPSARTSNSRLAARAAEIGDQEALALATGNLFAQALNARDRDEMRRLRPALLALITPETSTKSLGWIHYFLALDAYVDGRLESACEHASLSAEKAEAIGHQFMLASAVGTRLLAQSARDGVIAHPALAEALELMRRPSVQPLAAVALWLVARYAAGVAPEASGRWLAHAERILAALDSEVWPESVLRDETVAVLDIKDVAPLLDSTPPLDHAAALAQGAAWLAERDPAEEAPGKSARRFTSAPT
jgi:hypothetical protein